MGDEADAAGPAKELLPIAGQVPDAVPAMPPPSNAVVDTEVPVVEVPVAEVPAVEVPVADAATELRRGCLWMPNDACGIEPPMPLHAGLVTVVVDASDVIIGLVPATPSPVAPQRDAGGWDGRARDRCQAETSCQAAKPVPRQSRIPRAPLPWQPSQGVSS